MADEKEEGQWSIFEDSNDYRVLGFLQMCIERRFHLAVQDCFQKVTGLTATTYWIHTDVGGAPKMEDNDAAPKYCYDPPQNARVMGWSAHGSTCGGFKPSEGSDAQILDALQKTLNTKPGLYPEARHIGFFARAPREGAVEIRVIYPEIEK